MNYEEIEQDIKKTLSEKRYRHSKGVEQIATILAKVYGQEVESIRKIAIAHDVAKEMKSKELYEYAKDNHITLDEIEIQEPNIVHSKVGAHICQKRYRFTKEMAEAIIYHTTGNVKMNTMDKIIFIADKIEPNRTYLDTNAFLEIAKQDLDHAILKVCQLSMKHTLDKVSLIHPDTIFLMNQIIMQKKEEKEN